MKRLQTQDHGLIVNTWRLVFTFKEVNKTAMVILESLISYPEIREQNKAVIEDLIIIFE